jgi:hypothetical protein
MNDIMTSQLAGPPDDRCPRRSPGLPDPYGIANASVARHRSWFFLGDACTSVGSTPTQTSTNKHCASADSYSLALGYLLLAGCTRVCISCIRSLCAASGIPAAHLSPPTFCIFVPEPAFLQRQATPYRYRSQYAERRHPYRRSIRYPVAGCLRNDSPLRRAGVPLEILRR